VTAIEIRGHARLMPVVAMAPNPWNVNVMSPEMLDKERASIRRYGFMDPVTVRFIGDNLDGPDYQIVDGEHRWRIAQELGLTQVPTWDLGVVDEDTAKEMGLVLNETRGESEPGKLSVLLQDLLRRRDESGLRDVMPFTRERFDALTQRKSVDWSALERKRQALQEEDTERWVEKVYRMPRSAADVLDQAIAKIRQEEQVGQDWRALELMAAESLAS
jgi:hypothetical protein